MARFRREGEPGQARFAHGRVREAPQAAGSKARHEELKGRQFHTGDERLLTGIIKCAKYKSHIFGASGTKNGVLRPYYVCSKRFNYHECQQDYLRGDLLEAAIIEDVKSIFRDEQFMARLWEEANKRLGAEKPDLEKEIARVDGLMAKTQGTIDRYFEAFEAGTLKAELCNEKVMAEGPNPKKKHLLRHMVKKVLIHDRRTIEVWYGLPNQASDRTAGHLAPWAGLEPAT